MMSETPGSDSNDSSSSIGGAGMVSEKDAGHFHFHFATGLQCALNSSVHFVWAWVKAHLNLKPNKPSSEAPKKECPLNQRDKVNQEDETRLGPFLQNSPVNEK